MPPRTAPVLAEGPTTRAEQAPSPLQFRGITAEQSSGRCERQDSRFGALPAPPPALRGVRAPGLPAARPERSPLYERRVKRGSTGPQHAPAPS